MLRFFGLHDSNHSSRLSMALILSHPCNCTQFGVDVGLSETSEYPLQLSYLYPVPVSSLMCLHEQTNMRQIRQHVDHTAVNSGANLQ